MSKIVIACLPLNDTMRSTLGCDSCTINQRPDGSSFPNKMCKAGFAYQHPHLPHYPNAMGSLVYKNQKEAI